MLPSRLVVKAIRLPSGEKLGDAARPIRATVSLSALRHNYAVAKRAAPRSKVLAVVKANAYGHDAPLCARAAPAPPMTVPKTVPKTVTERSATAANKVTFERDMSVLSMMAGDIERWHTPPVAMP